MMMMNIADFITKIQFKKADDTSRPPPNRIYSFFA
jgi:hypothetical protein